MADTRPETLDDFLDLMSRVRSGCRQAAAELVARYGDELLPRRAAVPSGQVPTPLRFRLRRFHDQVFADFFAGMEKQPIEFRDPEHLLAFLVGMASNVVNRERPNGSIPRSADVAGTFP